MIIRDAEAYLEELELIKNKYDLLNSNLKVIIGRYQDTIIFISDNIKKYCIKTEEIIGKSISQITNIVDSHKLEKVIDLAKNLGIKQECCITIEVNGILKYFLINIIPEEQEEEKWTSVFFVLQEIKKENDIKYPVNFDMLTGLNNRLYFESSLQKYNKMEYLPLGIIIFDINGLKAINDSFGHVFGDDFIKVVSRTIKNSFDFKDCVKARIGGDEFAILIQKTNEEEINKSIDNFKENLKNTSNVSLIPSISVGYALKTDSLRNIVSIYKLAEDRMYKNKLLQLASSRSSIIASLHTSLHEKTHETKQHCDRIKKLSIEVGNELNLNSNDIDDIGLLGMLHDIGKIAIPDQILNKPSRLDQDEWEIMKKHCEIGYRIASSTKDIYSISEGILSHHESWDGTGYPKGLKNDEIPLISRIIAVVDAYDAMTNNRVYRNKMKEEDAIKELLKCSGKQFDPFIVEVFIRVISR